MSSTHTTLKFFLLQKGEILSISDMTEPETAAIEDSVKDLLPSAFQFTGNFWFETDTCDSLGEEQGEYGLLKCVAHDPLSSGYNTIPHAFPQKILDLLLSTEHRISPSQYGLKGWGKNIKVRFEIPFQAAVSKTDNKEVKLVSPLSSSIFMSQIV